MRPFDRNVIFASVDLLPVMAQAPAVMGDLMRQVAHLFREHPDCLHEPRPVHAFSSERVEDAMRLLQGGKNMGKAVVEFATGHQLRVSRTHFVHPCGMLACSKHQVRPALTLCYNFSSDATYAIGGGLGGLGRNVVRWMISRGARNFLLLSRSGIARPTPAVSAFLKDVREAGGAVQAPACDITDAAALQAALEQCARDMPPVRDCIQAAMVLHDDLFENMTAATLHRALRPKVDGSWNLHRLLPEQLDFFVLLSSFTGVIGNRGQANYAAGNTFEDALARHRLARGLSAVSLNLALVLEAGSTAENHALAMAARRAGGTGLRQDQVLAVLDVVCDPALGRRYPGTPQLSLVGEGLGELWAKGHENALVWLRKPPFANLKQIATWAVDGSRIVDSEKTGEGGDDKVDYRRAVRESVADGGAGVEKAAEVVQKGMARKLGKLLSVSESEVDTDKPPYVLGVDSLVAVELRYWFMKELGVEVAVFEVLKDRSVKELCRWVVDRLTG